MPRGRPVRGEKRLEKCDGSEAAKKRAEVVLEYNAGKRTAKDCARELGIGESRFHEIVAKTMQGAVSANEPKKTGRPLTPETETPRERQLQEELASLERQVRVQELLGEFPWLRSLQPKKHEPPDPVSGSLGSPAVARRRTRNASKNESGVTESLDS